MRTLACGMHRTRGLILGDSHTGVTVLSDTHCLNIRHPHSDAHNRSVCKARCYHTPYPTLERITTFIYLLLLLLVIQEGWLDVEQQ